ncbi:MAG: hypothetical protein K8T89_07915 [Planctomycetes bacterium]|nr:hypothetical protein [Planctomycetota bacterium]
MLLPLFSRVSLHGWSSRILLLLASGLLLLSTCAGAADPVAVVIVNDDSPPLLARSATDKPWEIVLDKHPLIAGAQVVGGIGATFDSANGAVRGRLIGDVGGHSPFPIFESSLILQEAKEVDFAFEMDRGRIDLINQKKSGSAKVKVTIRGESGEITLAEPGTRLVIEMYSRWPKGTKFTKTPKETDAPALALLFIAVKGEVSLKGKNHTIALKAPPGPALMMIDGLTDKEPLTEVLEKLPDWIETQDVELLKKIRTSVGQFRALSKKTSIDQALSLMAFSHDETVRRTAVILLGALDDLPRLGAAMATAKHDDALIDFLEHDRLLIRGLAHWHLVRLVQEGKKIGYKPVSTKEEREKMIKAWKELVPSGTTPGQPKEPK